MDFWSFFWLLVWGFFFVMYLMLMFQLVTDLIRDPDLGGLAKVLWLIGLIVVPFLVALIYVAARGRGMIERRDAELRRQQHLVESISPATHSGGAGAATEIASAKKLLDDGTITQQEFDSLKAKVLS